MTITYQKFIELIRDGENYRVDFKVQCDAFASTQIAPKAELVKDICALSNNGNVTSYYIIGVSDDKKTFKSVNNPHLKDETIQDYCKRNIFPPPKLQVIHKKWVTGREEVINKEYVIIKVGPHKRAAYRLQNDFIAYKENVALRRNEVWIRRGTISDIATPEEVARLVNGLSLIENKQDIKKKDERENFSRRAEIEKKNVINTTLKAILRNSSTLLPENEWPVNRNGYSYYENTYRYETYIKEARSKIYLFNRASCLDKFLKNDVVQLRHLFYLDSGINENLLKRIPENINKKIQIHRISIIPVLATVNRNRISNILNDWQWNGNYLWFTHSPSAPRKKKDSPKAYTLVSEVIFIDNILSPEDFYEKLGEILSNFKVEVPPLVNQE